MDSGWNLVGHLFWVNFWRQETLNFDLYDSSNKKIGEPPTKLGGQTKLVNFVPESIVPNIVECFSTSRKAVITCSPRLKLP